MNTTTRPGRRTDVHAPSSPDFDPQAYTCYGVVDFNPEWDMSEIARRRELVNEMLAKGYRFGGSAAGGCGHCGTNIRYGALMARDDVMQMIWVGETCLDGRFELEKGEFQKLRRTASLNRERMARDARFELLCDENPDLAYATYARNIYDVVVDDRGARFGNVSGCSWALSTLADIADKARQYGNPSKPQLALVSRLLVEVSEKTDAYAAKMAEQADKPAAKDVPTGRVEITGRIIKVDTRDNPYSGGVRVVMTVEHETEGWRVWGTMPAALDRADADKGDLVTFTATVEASADDVTFGYFGRAAKASIIK